MERISIALLLLVLLAGCSDEPGGTIQFSITGATSLSDDLSGDVSIDWDGENPWTRELACELDSSLSSSSWTVIAVDRSIGNGLIVQLEVQEYDGPQTYTRDRFQPQSALTIEHEDADTGVRTLLDLADGGACSITLEDGSRAGSFDCDGLLLAVDEGTEEVGVRGTFACSSLTHVNKRDSERGRGGYSFF